MTSKRKRKGRKKREKEGKQRQKRWLFVKRNKTPAREHHHAGSTGPDTKKSPGGGGASGAQRHPASQGLVGRLSILTPRREGWVDNGRHEERCHQCGLKGIIAVGGLLVTISRKQTQLQQSQI